MSASAYTDLAQNRKVDLFRHAPHLISAGYSPFPRVRRDGEAKPGIKGWSDLCGRQPTAAELRQWAAIKDADISLATGYGGLLAIDVDTDDPQVLEAVQRALPHCNIARFGSKGFALLVRYADGPCKGFNVYSADEARKSPLVEVLGLGRNCTIPPSIHSKTGRPYQWIDPATGEPPLHDEPPFDDELPPLSELPVVSADDLEKLCLELTPFSRKPREPRKRAAEGACRPDDKRLQAYAEAGLRQATADLAGAREGRAWGLFKGVCGLGWAVHHHYLCEQNFADAFIEACRQNGFVGKVGLCAVEASIDSGLAKSANDDVPELEDRFCNGAGSGNAKSNSGNGAGPDGNSGGDRDDGIRGGNPKWADPDPLPEGLPPVASFDLGLLPETLRPWAADIVETMQAPPDFAGVTIMTALGTVIGRKIGIRPQRNTGWTETANQWGVVIGRPGILKSPTVEACLAPLKALGAAAVAEFNKGAGEREIAAKIANLRAGEMLTEARKFIRKNPDAPADGFFRSSQSEPEPTLRRYISNDPTAAALGQLLIENPNGMLVYRDELVSLFQGLDREDNAEGRGFYLQGWNGTNPYTFDRIVRGMHLHVSAVCLSVLGSTQPGKIARYLSTAVRGGAGDDGLIQRFGLMVWPDASSDWEDVDRPLQAASKRRAFQVFKDLDSMDPLQRGAKQDIGFDGEPEGIPYLRFDDEALEAFRDWRKKLERRLRSGELHPAMESHLAKYRKLVPSLALITHLANGGHGAIGIDAVSTALAWANYLETHAARAYASVTMVELNAAKAIVAKIKSRDLPPEFTVRQILRKCWAFLSEKDEVEKGLDLLIELGWLAAQKQETGGRPSFLYLLNPKLRP